MKTKVLGKAIKIVSALLCICLVFIAILSLDSLLGTKDGTAKSVYEVQTRYIAGKPYLPHSMVHYVIIGVDEYDYQEEMKSSGVYNNDHTADFILVVSVNFDDDSYTLIQINRDTMATIDILGLSGGVIGQTDAQIALAHTQGNGLEKSSVNTVHAVSNFLLSIPIHNYITMNMTAVAKLSDHLGGVQVTLTEDQDYSSINPTWLPNATITLAGEDTFSFVSARMKVDDGTNISRMSRQRQYLEAVFSKKDSFDTSYSNVYQLYNEISPYMLSNCNVDELLELMKILNGYTDNGIVTPKGVSSVVEVDGKPQTQFTVDAADLEQIVINTCYKSIY